MDNKLRIKRVKEGIKLLENGKDPFVYSKMSSIVFSEYLGLTDEGFDLLILNGTPSPSDDQLRELIDNGFIWSEQAFDIKPMLHNWRRFLELIEKIK